MKNIKDNKPPHRRKSPEVLEPRKDDVEAQQKLQAFDEYKRASNDFEQAVEIENSKKGLTSNNRPPKNIGQSTLASLSQAGKVAAHTAHIYDHNPRIEDSLKITTNSVKETVNQQNEKKANINLLQSLKDEVPQAVLVGNTLRLDELHKTLNLPQADFSKILNDWREEGTGNTLLHKAALGLDLNMVNKLLEYGIDPTAKNAYKHNAKVALFYKNSEYSEEIYNAIDSHKPTKEVHTENLSNIGKIMTSQDTNNIENPHKLTIEVPTRPQSANAAIRFFEEKTHQKVKGKHADKVSDKNHNASINGKG
jgi:hypothetical protein